MWELSNATRWGNREACYVGRREVVHFAATPPLKRGGKDHLPMVVDGTLDSPNVDPGYRDILRSGLLPF